MPRTEKNRRWLFTHTKLLFDKNLSARLKTRLANLYPDSTHVNDIGLTTASDSEVWNHARDNDHLIVSKDVDFSKKSVIYGHPPKVIWLRLGNCSTRIVEERLRNYYSVIRTFAIDSKRGLLVLL